MNALIYADEYCRLERHLDLIQQRLATRRGASPCQCRASKALVAERDSISLRLMQLDDLIAFDAGLAV